MSENNQKDKWFMFLHEFLCTHVATSEMYSIVGQA